MWQKKKTSFLERETDSTGSVVYKDRSINRTMVNILWLCTWLYFQEDTGISIGNIKQWELWNIFTSDLTEKRAAVPQISLF